MNQLSKKILACINENHGIKEAQLMEKFSDTDSANITKQVNQLILSNRICFTWSKFYPIVRSIQKSPIGSDDPEDMEEIDLEVFISSDEIQKYFQPHDEDANFVMGYLINASNKELFERTNHFVFDLKRFEYYMLCGFDNTNDINV